HPQRLYNGSMSLDTGIQDLAARPSPPVLGEDLDLAGARIAGGFHFAAYGLELDDAVTHHAAIIHEVARRRQPVAHMVGQQAIGARAPDLAEELGVPPHVIDV